MLYTVREFCGYVQDDLNGLIDEVAGITRYVSDEEKKAYAGYILWWLICWCKL